MDDAGTGSPESDVVLAAHALEEVVNLLVSLTGFGKVLLHTHIGSYEMVAMDSGGNGHTVLASVHELEQGHLSGGILHGHAVRSEVDVVVQTLVGTKTRLVVNMSVKHFLGVSKTAAKDFACVSYFPRI